MQSHLSLAEVKKQAKIILSSYSGEVPSFSLIKEKLGDTIGAENMKQYSKKISQMLKDLKRRKIQLKKRNQEIVALTSQQSQMVGQATEASFTDQLQFKDSKTEDIKVKSNFEKTDCFHNSELCSKQLIKRNNNDQNASHTQSPSKEYPYQIPSSLNRYYQTLPLMTLGNSFHTMDDHQIMSQPLIAKSLIASLTFEDSEETNVEELEYKMQQLLKQELEVLFEQEHVIKQRIRCLVSSERSYTLKNLSQNHHCFPKFFHSRSFQPKLLQCTSLCLLKDTAIEEIKGLNALYQKVSQKLSNFLQQENEFKGQGCKNIQQNFTYKSRTIRIMREANNLIANAERCSSSTKANKRISKQLSKEELFQRRNNLLRKRLEEFTLPYHQDNQNEASLDCYKSIIEACQRYSLECPEGDVVQSSIRFSSLNEKLNERIRVVIRIAIFIQNKLSLLKVNMLLPLLSKAKKIISILINDWSCVLKNYKRLMLKKIIEQEIFKDADMVVDFQDVFDQDDLKFIQSRMRKLKMQHKKKGNGQKKLGDSEERLYQRFNKVTWNIQASVAMLNGLATNNNEIEISKQQQLGINQLIQNLERDHQLQLDSLRVRTVRSWIRKQSNQTLFIRRSVQRNSNRTDILKRTNAQYNLIENFINDANFIIHQEQAIVCPLIEVLHHVPDERVLRLKKDWEKLSRPDIARVLGSPWYLSQRLMAPCHLVLLGDEYFIIEDHSQYKYKKSTSIQREEIDKAPIEANNKDGLDNFEQIVCEESSQTESLDPLEVIQMRRKIDMKAEMTELFENYCRKDSEQCRKPLY